jgi:hypothetical protein
VAFRHPVASVLRDVERTVRMLEGVGMHRLLGEEQ